MSKKRDRKRWKRDSTADPPLPKPPPSSLHEKMSKKRKIPEVLWRIFRDRALTLANAILSFFPPSAQYSAIDCRCKGNSCLLCGGGSNTMSSLVRPDDPSEYRFLMNNCFIVVADNAPPLSHFSHQSRWSQKKIVATTIEHMGGQSMASNVICSGYDQVNQSSLIVELLSRPAWELLLRRVGDDIMVYLLKHTSIFLPHPQKKHQQVAGLPVTDLCSKSSTSNHSRHQWRKNAQISLPDASPQTTTNPTSYEGNSSKELQGKSEAILTKLGKRSRPFSWQRQRKRRHLNSEDNHVVTHCMDIPAIKSPSELNPSSSCSRKLSCRCSCSSILQTTKKISKGAQFNRRCMFYNSGCSSSVLPKNHVLNSLNPNSTSSRCLTRHIFGSSDVNVNAHSMPLLYYRDFCPFGPSCQYHHLPRLIKLLLYRAKKCKHKRLLDKHCVSPSEDQISGSNLSSTIEESELGNDVVDKSQGFGTKQSLKSLEADNPQLEAIKFCSSRVQVVSFIWAACRSMVPEDLLGTPSNQRILKRNISRFIQLRRFEKFSLKQAMHGLKISGFPNLLNKFSPCCLNDKECNKSNDATCRMKQNLLESWIFWFFQHLVVSLLQANFYVTETEHGKQDVYYYRKSSWEELTNKAINSLKDQGYSDLNDSSARNILAKRPFGFSRLRLLPKGKGVRLLANLKAPSRMAAKEVSMGGRPGGVQRRAKNDKFDYYKPVNYVLRDTHAVLKGIQLKEPELLGSSIFDYNDVYKKLSSFLIGLKKGAVTMPHMFIVVSDVSKAFDSVNQDKLLSVMENIISNDEYHFKQCKQVLCNKKSLWVQQNVALADPNISSRFLFSSHFRSLHSVIVNQESSRSVKTKELFSYLIQHVKHNVLQIEKKFYLQGIGIPQGSVLSSLLCSFYYGDLDRKIILPFLEKSYEGSVEENPLRGDDPRYMMLRFIDDILFISTSKKHATYFFDRLQRGFHNYNCSMNEKKYGLNFNIGQRSGLLPNSKLVGEDGSSFLRWSGLLINCCTLEVQADYTKYLNNHLSSSLTVCWQGKPAHNLKAKLCSYVRPKCHPMLFDLNINSAAVIALNIFQVFLLSAMKFHCYVCHLSYICEFGPKFCFYIIRRSLRYMYSLIKRRMYSIGLGSDLRPSFRMKKQEVEWLGLNAYMQVLQRKQARHTGLLSLLTSKLFIHKISHDVSSELADAVDSSHSSSLWRIKY